MKTLDDELKKLGFSDDLVSAVNKSEYLDVQGIKVEEFHFQDYENGIITSTNVSINDESNTSDNYFVTNNV